MANLEAAGKRSSGCAVVASWPLGADWTGILGHHHGMRARREAIIGGLGDVGIRGSIRKHKGITKGIKRVRGSNWGNWGSIGSIKTN